MNKMWLLFLAALETKWHFWHVCLFPPGSDSASFSASCSQVDFLSISCSSALSKCRLSSLAASCLLISSTITPLSSHLALSTLPLLPASLLSSSSSESLSHPSLLPNLLTLALFFSSQSSKIDALFSTYVCLSTAASCRTRGKKKKNPALEDQSRSQKVVALKEKRTKKHHVIMALFLFWGFFFLLFYSPMWNRTALSLRAQAP